MNLLNLPKYKSWFTSSQSNLKNALYISDFLNIYKEISKNFNDLPYSLNDLFKEVDKILYFNNSSYWEHFRNLLINTFSDLLTLDVVKNKNKISNLEDFFEFFKDDIEINPDDKQNSFRKILELYQDYLVDSIKRISIKIVEYIWSKSSKLEIGDKDLENLSIYYDIINNFLINLIEDEVYKQNLLLISIVISKNKDKFCTILDDE